MKKVFFAFIACIVLTACTDQQAEQNELYEEGIEKGKECPPLDRNCNGVPDTFE